MAMLAQSFDTKKLAKGKHVKFPCIIQPKLDGIRCLATVADGECVLHTRNGNVLTSVPHINEALSALPDGMYDGELYNHEILFNILSGSIRRIKGDGTDNINIQFVVYDYEGSYKNITISSPYSDRLHFLSTLRDSGLLKDCLQLIDYQECTDLDELLKINQEHLDAGYEGSMLRTMIYDRATKQWIDPGYEHKRSWSLLKVKKFHEAEYLIAGIQEEYDKFDNPKGRTGAFLLMTEDGKSFTASGIVDAIKVHSWEHPDFYIGKLATIKYFELSPDGIPRFPNFKDIRDDI